MIRGMFQRLVPSLMVSAVQSIALSIALSAACPALAHKASDAYLHMSDVPGDSLKSPPSGATRWVLSLALRDIDAALETLDANNDRQLTWGEIDDARVSLERWTGEGLSLSCDGQTQAPVWTFQALEKRDDGHFARLAMDLPCAPESAIGLRYRLMAQQDPTHRLLVAGTLAGRPVVAVVSDADPLFEVRPASKMAGDGPRGTSILTVVLRFFKEGLHHLSTGYDHLAFLLILILPIRLFNSKRFAADVTASAPSQAAWRLVKVITAFTLGHSITLSLAALGWITAPGWIEPAIAFTILVSALLNLYAVRWVRADVLALAFGLVHGLGFSSAIREAGVDSSLLPWALAGFNLGIEAGQLLALSVWFAAQSMLTRMAHYDLIVVRGGSYALLMLALFWTVQRI